MRSALLWQYFCGMTQLVLASDNAGKIKELKAFLSGVQLLSLSDIGFAQEIPEPYHTFRENAYTKAHTVHQFCGKNVLSDDSGLCVDALQGAPGVISAHYAGFPKDNTANLQKVLQELQGQTNRAAHYIAVLCLIWQGQVYYFEGKCYGTILQEPIGDGGFGYDPLFVPDGYTLTFAQLPAEVKNRISHRAVAMQALQAFIAQQLTP
jgi:XTP/dITP diphosphohydrolase